jgi:hypothetical protein
LLPQSAFNEICAFPLFPFIVFYLLKFFYLPAMIIKTLGGRWQELFRFSAPSC